jgi:hypothetical protein
MMGAESTRNMYSNLAVNNKHDCLKLHHVGCLIKKRPKQILLNLQATAYSEAEQSAIQNNNI